MLVNYPYLLSCQGNSQFLCFSHPTSYRKPGGENVHQSPDINSQYTFAHCGWEHLELPFLHLNLVRGLKKNHDFSATGLWFSTYSICFKSSNVTELRPASNHDHTLLRVPVSITCSFFESCLFCFYLKTNSTKLAEWIVQNYWCDCLERCNWCLEDGFSISNTGVVPVIQCLERALHGRTKNGRTIVWVCLFSSTTLFQPAKGRLIG